MMSHQAQALNPLTLPLFGERLIEASAGTGKTYTIGVLYLRLLLGLGGANAYPRRLNVDEILVVTFTEAATQELRGRIRDNIHQLRLNCAKVLLADDRLLNEIDPTERQLLDEIIDKHQAMQILLSAERQMDNAAIYTIHGFCQRMLTQNAFESGMLFEQHLLQDEQQLRHQVVADFWRRTCYPVDTSLAKEILRHWQTPDDLLATIGRYLSGEVPHLLHHIDVSEPLEARHKTIINQIETLKSAWREAGNLHDLIAQSAIDKRSYSSKNLPKWIDEIDLWAQQPTTDYSLPKKLDVFSQSRLVEKTKSGEAPQHKVFETIETILSQPLSLQDLIMVKALKAVREALFLEKRRQAEMGFDDLLSRLDSALASDHGEALAQQIRQRYPVAMIDEFQDTDAQQYRIFSSIYLNQPNTGLLLIGDPKQAIYAFRGADIFTYMQVRQQILAHYTLNRNWRSAPAMINCVNQLFMHSAKPFIFEQIPFIEVDGAERNRALRFHYQGVQQPAFNFWLKGEACGTQDYLTSMATYCAQQIRDWLSAGQQGDAILSSPQGERNLTANDITILVRSGSEAQLMREALRQLNIASVYLSDKESVFSSPEATDILWLLQAVIAPQHEVTLRRAMACQLLGLSCHDIEQLNQDEMRWDELVAEFDSYRQTWKKQGVLPMLRQLMRQRKLAENLLSSHIGERRLTDVMHLGELLQQASNQLEGEAALIRWLNQQITQPNMQVENQQLRLENDRNLVQICTIHKSKGLEYPLVCLPFIANYRTTDSALFHDRSSFESILDLDKAEKSLLLAEEERLAEDLRLLYVALTRSKYHCSVGIAPLFKGRGKREGESDLHRSALGYLVQQGEAMDGVGLDKQLQCLSEKGLAVTPLTDLGQEQYQPSLRELPALSAKTFTGTIKRDWRVTSYSGLQQQGAHSFIPRLNLETKDENEALILNAHSFPKGATAGTFLHSLFEEIDFTAEVDGQWLEQQLESQGFDPMWTDVLLAWMNAILATPLGDNGVSLSQLSPEQTLVEMQFFLPIKSPLQAKQLDAIAKNYDPLSAQCPELTFESVQGMLKGFIDLVFSHDGKYYVLDYKSNYLGADATAYTQQAMSDAMCDHHYELQYQLYTLALHRYLSLRIKNYDYETHFGGVYYLFLRGMEGDSKQGVYHTRLPYQMVQQLDQLFDGTFNIPQEM